MYFPIDVDLRDRRWVGRADLLLFCHRRRSICMGVAIAVCKIDILRKLYLHMEKGKLPYLARFLKISRIFVPPKGLG